jgi:NhaP-type Na+/H+ or K+/H+ antiporter
MANQEIALAITAVCFGAVIGFLAGYAVRAYISYLRHRSWAEHEPLQTPDVKASM